MKCFRLCDPGLDPPCRILHCGNERSQHCGHTEVLKVPDVDGVFTPNRDRNISFSMTKNGSP